MKKPDITPGEWKLELGNQPLADTGDYVSFAEIRGETGQLIAQCHETRQIDVDQQQINAKAISAVPDMVDALIEAKKAIESLGDFDLGVTYTDSYPGDPPDGYRNKDALLHEIEQALRKAGCE